MANELVPVPCQSAGVTTATAQAKVFTLTNIQYGDCNLSSGKLVLLDSGLGVFEAAAFTYHTTKGDYWHFYFALEDAVGNVLFKTDAMTSPKIPGFIPPRTVTWTARFLFDPAHFGPMVKALQYCSC